MAVTNTEYGVGYDTTFEINEFGKARLRSEIETIKNAVLFLLFCKPGQYPSLPHLGLDIQSYLYSFYDEIDTEQLKDDLITQCEALGIPIKSGAIAIKKLIYDNQPSLFIHIEGDATYPSDYMKDTSGSSNKYMIGITYDELNRMIYNVNG